MKLILVIEDDRDLALFFKTALEIMLKDVQVEIAVDGSEGMKRLKNASLPDAIVLDMHLPGISGEVIYKALEDRNQGHRVLICTADINLVKKYSNALSKPVSVDDLCGRVQQIMSMVPLAGGCA